MQGAGIRDGAGVNSLFHVHEEARLGTTAKVLISLEGRRYGVAKRLKGSCSCVLDVSPKRLIGSDG
jgi:hypothetical protein